MIKSKNILLNLTLKRMDTTFRMEDLTTPKVKEMAEPN
jgi:hypothetical protein